MADAVDAPAVTVDEAPTPAATEEAAPTAAAPAPTPTAAGDAAPSSTAKPRSDSARSSGKKRRSTGKSSSADYANGGSFDYADDYDEMDEPFSDSDDDTDAAREARARAPRRPHIYLPVSRGRIRTLSGTVPPVGYAPVWGGPTMCLGCLEFFDLPRDADRFTAHLLEKHHIVIGGIEHIVDLKRYVEHWRHRFGKQSIHSVFPTVTPKPDEPLHGRCDWYYYMNEDLADDRKLRERLALRRLEEVLSCQHRERSDITFTQQCLFCRYTTRGNRSKLIHHLYMIHHLNLGSPDNLVFVAEYIDLLKSKLDRNECIYCEKRYTERQALMDHMRKRQHREVNPKNNYYDKFYIINYLELGKKWLDVMAEDFEDKMPTFVDSDDEEEEETWNEWQEDNADEDLSRVVCLFCDQCFDELPPLLQHSKDEHKFDIIQTLTDLELDFYGRTKFVNYIRKLSYECSCFVCGENDLRSWQALRKHLAANDHLVSRLPPRDRWEHDKYLLPVFENDHLLWLLESVWAEAETAEGDAAVSGVVAEEANELGEPSVLATDPDLLDQLK